MKDSTSFFEKCLLWYFPLDMVYRFLFLREIDSHLILPLQVFIFLYAIYSYSVIHFGKSFRDYVALFIIYSILSFILVAAGNGPIAGYFNDLRVVILPMSAVFIGIHNKSDNLYKVFLYSVVISMIIGLYLYFAKPSWYIQHLINYWNDQWYTGGMATEENIMSGAFLWSSRFSSIFVTPYAVSYYGTFALCMLTVDIYKDKNNRLIKSRWVQWSFFVILAIGAFLCQNRVAIVYLVFLIVLALVYGIKNNRSERKFFMYLVVGIAIIFTFTVVKMSKDEFFSVIIDTFVERVEDTQENGLYNTSRDSQIVSTLKSWDNYMLGEGLGSRGGVARRLGLPGVTDNGYVKLLVEQGIIGFVFLMFIFLKSARRAYKHRRYLSTELLIIGYVLFTMIGANTLGMEFDYMIIMWFALGHIWNIRYLDECIVSNNRI